MAKRGPTEDFSRCSVCLEPNKPLKFLSCHHSFCCQCIQQVADRHPGRRFPCPSCRAMTTLPAGGVTALQTNFYLQAAKRRAAEAQSGDLCKTHADKKLEYYCEVCDDSLCINCKLTEHEGHRTRDISAAAWSKRPDLLTDQDRLERAVSTVIGQVAGRQEELQALQQKTRALEADIERRHQLVVNTAGRWKQEAIQSLHSLTADIKGDVSRQLTQRQRQLDTLLDIQRQLQNVLRSGTDSDVIAMAKEMKSGRGSPSEVNNMTSQEKDVIVRPVLQFNVTADVMAEKTRDYLGSVRKMEMTVTQDDVTVEEKFTCTEDPGWDVFSLCHKDTDPSTVKVSYDNKTLLQPDMPGKTFRETGECVHTGTGKEVGRLTYRRYAKGRVMFQTLQSDLFITFSKSLTAAHFLLHNYLTGQANIFKVKVLSTDPFKTEAQTQFTITVGPHRAWEVDETEQYFVVVEEPQPPAKWRSVKLYRRPLEAQPSFSRPQTAVATYTPPSAFFQPSDVCFHRLGGQQVLLICDELNDAIHVVTVWGWSNHMTFQRYLCGGHPLLVQPTAITVDLSGRLWVGCRGGRVVTLNWEGGGKGESE